MLTSIIKLIRPTHWIKNVFVLLPLFFAGKVGDSTSFYNVLIAFVSFSLVASSVYIMNDILDRAYDAQHIHKKNRPIASGLISISLARVLFVFLLGIGLTLGYFININILYLLLFYLLMNTLYSFGLKQIAILDVAIIAIGFVVRVYVGGFAADVPISSWIVIMTFLMALFLGLGKRRSEMVLAKQDGFEMRQSLQGYTLEFINYMIIIVITAALVAYLMYCFSPDVLARLDDKPLYLSFVFVWMGMMRYLQLIIVQNSTLTPTQLVTSDWPLIFIFLLWVLSFVYFIYL